MVDSSFVGGGLRHHPPPIASVHRTSFALMGSVAVLATAGVNGHVLPTVQTKALHFLQERFHALGPLPTHRAGSSRQQQANGRRRRMGRRMPTPTCGSLDAETGWQVAPSKDPRARADPWQQRRARLCPASQGSSSGPVLGLDGVAPGVGLNVVSGGRRRGACRQLGCRLRARAQALLSGPGG